MRNKRKLKNKTETDSGEAATAASLLFMLRQTLSAGLIVWPVTSGRVGETSLRDYAALCMRPRERERENVLRATTTETSCCHSNRLRNFMLMLRCLVSLHAWRVCDFPEGRDWCSPQITWMINHTHTHTNKYAHKYLCGTLPVTMLRGSVHNETLLAASAELNEHNHNRAAMDVTSCSIHRHSRRHQVADGMWPRPRPPTGPNRWNTTSKPQENIIFQQMNHQQTVHEPMCLHLLLKHSSWSVFQPQRTGSSFISQYIIALSPWLSALCRISVIREKETSLHLSRHHTGKQTNNGWRIKYAPKEPHTFPSFQHEEEKRDQEDSAWNL